MSDSETPERALHDLFVTFFDAEGLRRWTRLTFEDARIVHELPGSMASLDELSSRLVRLLKMHGLVDRRLFDGLREEFPVRTKDIERVRLLWPDAGTPPPLLPPLVPDDTHEPPPGAAPPFWRAVLSAFVAFGALVMAWLSQLRSLLLKAIKPLVEDERAAFRRRLQERRRSQDDPLRGWLEAVAVLDAFLPQQLRPVGATESGDVPLAALASRVTEQPDGRWVLQERWREPVLARLLKEGRFAEAQRANDDQRGPIARYMGDLAAGREPDFTSLDLEGLTDLSEALRWLGPGSNISNEWVARLTAFVERRRTIEPLRRLTGAHIRGREEQLARLRAHVEDPGEPEILALWGPGGVGKSTLLGLLLLEQEDARHELPRPFLYLDYDHPELDPLHPRGLVEAAARQLGQLYASRRDAVRAFIGIESAAAGDAFSFTAALGPDLQDAARGLAETLRKVAPGQPLLVVLDTFERVQLRGDVAVAQTRRFIEALQVAWPRTRVVISGRALASWDRPIESLHLDGLSRPAALATLAALGVEDRGLAARLVDEVGTTPLNLRLAAEVAARAGGSAVDGIAGHTRVLGEARDAIVQQGLYTRILGHLDDPTVRSFAHPGLIVRRLTPDVLARVLAGPCGFDPNRAQSLFDRLARQLTLLERDADGALRHRSDVRTLMLHAMLADPTRQAVIASIHAAAEAYYAGRVTIADRAELIYHRLWIERPTSALDDAWDPELAPLLASAWDEPLPVSARAWLGPRLGHGDTSTFDQTTWERYAVREAQLHLTIGEAAEALAVLRGRSARAPDSAITELELEALLQLGRAREAAGLLERTHVTVASPTRLRLDLLAMRIGDDLGDAQQVLPAGERAIALAERLDDVPAELRARLLQAKFLTGSAWRMAITALGERFVATDGELLRGYPALAAVVMRTVGPHSAQVLSHGVRVFGRTFDERGVLRFDVFAIGALMTEVAPLAAASAAMTRLATQVGLPEHGFDLRELAGQAIRAGRLDLALGIVLDHGGESAAVRARVVELLRDNPSIPESRV